MRSLEKSRAYDYDIFKNSILLLILSKYQSLQCNKLLSGHCEGQLTLDFIIS